MFSRQRKVAKILKIAKTIVILIMNIILKVMIITSAKNMRKTTKLWKKMIQKKKLRLKITMKKNTQRKRRKWITKRLRPDGIGLFNTKTIMKERPIRETIMTAIVKTVVRGQVKKMTKTIKMKRAKTMITKAMNVVRATTVKMQMRMMLMTMIKKNVLVKKPRRIWLF